jgi:hypothetical protein
MGGFGGRAGAGAGAGTGAPNLGYMGGGQGLRPRGSIF